MILFYGFLFNSHFFVCFFWSALMHTCVHSNWLYILNHENDVLKKIKFPKLYIKLALGTPRGLLKVVQSENIWRCFCASIDNFEQVSQITIAFLLPTLSIFCMVNVHSIPHCFYKTNIFHISWFYCTLIAADVQDFKRNCTLAGE